MPMDETLGELAAAAAELNKASDQLNAVIENFEDRLAEAGVGLTHWMEDELNVVERSPWQTNFDADAEAHWESCSGWVLGYMKIDGVWRVVVRRMGINRVNADHEWEFFATRDQHARPLVNAPRVVRLEALRKLEALAAQLTERMRDYTDGILEAQKLAQ